MLAGQIFLAIGTVTLATAAALPTSHEVIEKRGGGGTCSGGPWATDAFIEPSATERGTAFCETGWGASFVPISGVEMWTGDTFCNGIRFTYADGTVSAVYGQITNEYPPRQINVSYAIGQTFTKATLYGPPNTGVLAHVLLEASDGQVANCGEPVSDGAVARPVDVASGILLGAQGMQNPNVFSLGFLFLRSEVNSIDITNFNFPEGPSGSQGINPQTLAEGHFFNSQATGNSSWTFMDQKTVTNTQQFTSGMTTTFGNTVMFSITAMIPMIFSATASTSFTWTFAQMFTQSITNTQTTAVTWGESGSLAPGTGIDAAAIVGEGAGTFPYTSDVTLNLADGSSVTFPETGALTFSDVSQAIVEVTTDNSPT